MAHFLKYAGLFSLQKEIKGCCYSCFIGGWIITSFFKHYNTLQISIACMNLKHFKSNCFALHKHDIHIKSFGYI